MLFMRDNLALSTQIRYGYHSSEILRLTINLTLQRKPTDATNWHSKVKLLPNFDFHQNGYRQLLYLDALALAIENAPRMYSLSRHIALCTT